MFTTHIYDDPDYGWTVIDTKGLIHPCQNFNDAIEMVKKLGERYKPINKNAKDEKAKCILSGKCGGNEMHDCKKWCEDKKLDDKIIKSGVDFMMNTDFGGE